MSDVTRASGTVIWWLSVFAVNFPCQLSVNRSFNLRVGENGGFGQVSDVDAIVMCNGRVRCDSGRSKCDKITVLATLGGDFSWNSENFVVKTIVRQNFS